MTIDEAIDFAEDINATVTFPSESKLDEEFFDNIPEWLEELKAIKKGAVFYSNRPIEDIVLEARNDAIDEFSNWLVEQGILGNRCISDGEITDYGKVYAKKYKEQLKEQSDG